MKSTKIEEIEIGKAEAKEQYDAQELAMSLFIEQHPGQFTQVNAQVIGDREHTWVVQVMGSKGHGSVLGPTDKGLKPGDPHYQPEEEEPMIIKMSIGNTMRCDGDRRCISLHDETPGDEADDVMLIKDWWLRDKLGLKLDPPDVLDDCDAEFLVTFERVK